MPPIWLKPWATNLALYWAMLPMVSFLALKTHLDPMIFALAGASSSLQVPAAFKVASSSWMAFSHNGQSGHRLTSVSDRGSSASASAVSVRNMCSRPSKFSSSVGVPSCTDHAPPASSGSSTNDPGICRPGTCGTPSLDCRLHTMRDGF